MINKNKILIIIILMTAAVIASCNKHEKGDPVEAPVTNLQQISEDHNIMNNEFNSIFNTVDNAANEDSLISGKTTVSILPACAGRLFDAATKTLIIDFGETDCMCGDGLKRRGKIKAAFDGKYRAKGTTVTITLEDYFVENIEFKGTKIIENQGNGSGNFKYAYIVLDAQATTAGGTISWDTEATIERVEGDNTLTPWDDVYEGIGSSNGVNRDGNPFTVVIDPASPLVRKISMDPLCWRNFVAGMLTIEDDKNNIFKLDYDPYKDQLCDKVAQLVINGGKPITIYLR